MYCNADSARTDDIQIIRVKTLQTPLHRLLGHFGVIDVVFRFRAIFAGFGYD
jgi:hypothetical protein